VANGFVIAVRVIAEHLSPSPSTDVTGTFVNENSYAAFANLLIPVALALGRDAQRRASVEGDRSHPGYLLYFIAGMMVLSVFVSGSRTGICLCVLLTGAWLMIELKPGSGTRDAGLGVRAVPLLAPLIIALGLLLLLGTDLVKDVPASFRGLPVQVTAKARVCVATLRMLRENPLFGIGAGTFQHAFPYYQPEGLKGFYRYAHNDWLQYMVELGLVGSVLLAALIAASFAAWSNSSREGRRRQGYVEGVLRARDATGLALALAGLGLHAVVDFPLHVPAIALTAATWTGLIGAARAGDGRRRQH
jgi:O-antigen ligase